jgi:hypothetical protein
MYWVFVDVKYMFKSNLYTHLLFFGSAFLFLVWMTLAFFVGHYVAIRVPFSEVIVSDIYSTIVMGSGYLNGMISIIAASVYVVRKIRNMCIRSHVDNAVALVETGKEDPISL